MRTPPHLPSRARHENTGHARRHPYGPHEIPAQAAPRGTLDFPDTLSGTFSDSFSGTAPQPDLSDLPADPNADVFVERRLLGIREMSNQAIGSIDDLLQHTA
ncbi:hypothetical protein GCM10022224_013270 [Nonomuraea antimicrobica]|uniref:Uncharacterized protein n=1 Tax=Nonomuraea antimicrobica TaxID=561173 RepID=A0ABP7B7C7_9ACTN